MPREAWIKRPLKLINRDRDRIGNLPPADAQEKHARRTGENDQPDEQAFPNPDAERRAHDGHHREVRGQQPKEAAVALV